MREDFIPAAEWFDHDLEQAHDDLTPIISAALATAGVYQLALKNYRVAVRTDARQFKARLLEAERMGPSAEVGRLLIEKAALRAQRHQDFISSLDA